MRKKIETEAFVLKKKIAANEDSVITLLSLEFGKINCLAKGVRRITSRRSPHLQTGNLIYTILDQRNNRYFLRETKLISGFSMLKNTPSKYEHLYKMLFIIDRIMPENQEEIRIYLLVKRFFADISRSRSFGSSQFTLYLNVLLQELGYSNERKTDDELSFIIEELIHQKIPRISL